MNTEQKKHEPWKEQAPGETGSTAASAEKILERGAEVYEKAEQAVGEAYDKTAQRVGETYEQAKAYSSENPGKTILIALGIGIGIGLLLSANSSHRSRTGRYAQPVVNALSDIAQEFFR